MIPIIPTNYNLPPTLYQIMNSIVNFGSEEQTKIPDLAEASHSKIFDFTYPLSSKINKDEFEIMILNRYIMRRIGYETMTAFKIALRVKLNEIMPMYNKMFDMLEGWDLFNDGEKIVSSKMELGTSSAVSNGATTSENKYSDTPEGKIEDVQSGNYLTDYTYNAASTNQTSSGNDSKTSNEVITRSPSDKIKIYKEFLENRQSIMTMIYNDLDSLFYMLV